MLKQLNQEFYFILTYPCRLLISLYTYIYIYLFFFRLFDSPKAVPQNDWLRKDINDPSLVVVKRSLVKKLDEITSKLFK